MAFFNWNLLANLSCDLLIHVDRGLSADSPGKFSALFSWYIDWIIFTLLLRNTPTFRSWNLFRNPILFLLASLFWNLKQILSEPNLQPIYHLFTLLVISVPTALLFIGCSTFLFILIVYNRLVDHVALLLEGGGAPLLTAGVKHCPALCLSELIALLMIPNILKKSLF